MQVDPHVRVRMSSERAWKTGHFILRDHELILQWQARFHPDSVSNCMLVIKLHMCWLISLRGYKRADNHKKPFPSNPGEVWAYHKPIKPYMILKEHIEKNLKLAKPIELLRWWATVAASMDWPRVTNYVIRAVSHDDNWISIGLANGSFIAPI